MYGYGYDLTTLAKAFIALAFLVGMIEVVTLASVALLEISPWPKRTSFHWTVSYGLSCVLGAWVCWQGHFDLFTLLGFDWWQYHYLGYIGTGCIIGGGAKRLLMYFKYIRAIPGSVMGNTYTGSLDSDFEATPNLPESDQKGEM